MTKEKDKKVGKDQLLLEASRLGRFQQLESILSQMQQLKCKKRANPLASLRKIVGPNNIRDPVTGFTCLHHAALNGHADCVQLMLDYGAKVNAVDYKGSSALHLAAWVGNLEVVRILLAHRLLSSPKENTQAAGQQQHSQSQSAPLQEAARQSPTHKLRNAAQGVEVDLCNNDNQTPLSLAAQFGHTEVVAELLANGASVLVRNSQLESPLDLACLNGRLETVDLLLRSAPILVADLQRPRATIANLNVSHRRNQRLASSPSLVAGEQQQHHLLERSATTTSPPPAQPSATARRQSGGGWSALLRGRRGDQQNAAASQSPLHRLTSGTLSMRQSKTQQQQQAPASMIGCSSQLSSQLSSSSSASSTSSANAAELASREAATASSQQQHQQHQQLAQRRRDLSAGDHRQRLLMAQHQRQFSADWASLVAASTSGDQQADTAIICNEHQQQQQTEKLLEHSPLHYATRRGHLNVINLLLYTYQANILQVSSRGSILHEVALNNGKYSGDIINAAFVYLTNLPDSQNRLAVLDRFLNLKNANQQSVFEVLKEINNRSAQEIKRLIYEFSEQIHQLASQQQQQQQQQHTQLNTQANSTARNNSNLQSSSLLQQKQMHQFSDINQISSFVTMKRAPKGGQMLEQQQLGQSRNTILVDSTGRQLNWQPAQFPFGTQTIDRRQARDSQHQQAACRAAQMDQNQRQLQASNTFGLADRSPAATARSVSNLNRVSSQHASSGQQQLQLADQQQAAGSAWREWQPSSSGFSSVSGQQQQLAASFNVGQLERQQQQQAGLASRKRRSRSRDLGSLLMEAQQQQSRLAGTGPEATGGGRSSPFDNAPPPTSASGPAQLVRSQTDCSHLMGRFLGDQLGSTSCLPSASSASKDLQQQQHSTLDRKMINRHYHVYEHEFYPPRLLAGQESHNSANTGRQQVAVVPPLSRAGAAHEQGLLRASIRSTASCQVPSSGAATGASCQFDLPASKLTSGASQAGAEFGFGANNNSRLSLNIEPQASREARAAEPERRRLQPPSLASQAGCQQQQMDRFLYRHARKSAAAAPSGARCASSADQHRQELVELQRRLIAEQSASQQQHPQQYLAQQQQPMHTSYSLESHLGEPHLMFESTRQTLMKDFDQMIGNKLLNRDHRQIIDGNLGQQAAPQQQQQQVQRAAAGSQSSIFTGVSLDMDQFGERLTVSGTRVTTSANADCDSRNQHQSGSALSGSSKRSLQQAQPNASPKTTADRNMMSPESNFSTNSTRAGPELEVDNASDDDADESPREPPPKPPRLSLMNRQQQQQQQQQVLVRPLNVKHTQQPDDARGQPTTCPPGRDQQASGAESRSASTSSLGAQVPPKRPKQPAKAASSAEQQQLVGASLASGKPAPTSRPPPVPCPPKNRKTAAGLDSNHKSLSTSLQIVATSGGAGQAMMMNSGSSTASSDGGGADQMAAAAASVGLLKMATSAAPSTTDAQLSLANKQHAPAAGGANALALALRTAQSLGDPDSGVCTSNSPASLSHDSEEPPAEFQQQVESCDNGASLKRSKQALANNSAKTTTNSDASLSAVVKHLARPGSQAPAGPAAKPNSFRPINLTIEESADLQSAAPPSPNTAQLCIEEALMPLAKPPSTSDVANQTTSPICMSSTTDECQFVSPYSVSFVDRWLVESPAQQQQAVEDDDHAERDHAEDEGGQSGRRSTEADYDNCHGSALLERQLQATRCRSIGDLLLVGQLAASDCNVASGGGHEDEEGDYAAESSTTSQTSSSGTQTTCSELASSDSSLRRAQTGGRDEIEDDDSSSPARGGQLSSPSSSSGSSSSSSSAAAAAAAAANLGQAKRKELVLRVMIDEPPLGSLGDDNVFYINPSELKKLATPKSQTMDAETLTDEELCAAFDKSSGFIRFTLRKRRNQQQAEETFADDSSGCLSEAQHTQPWSAPKRTELNQADETAAQISRQLAEPSAQLSSQLKTRRHSEMTNQSTVGYNSSRLDSATRTRRAPGGICLSSSQSQLQQVSGSIGPDSDLFGPDFNNNNGSASRLINRLAAIQLRQWFSVNLVALCDYVDRFLLFGLDNVNFLNHPQLMNDSVLQTVGISQETHRVIILDRVGSELAPVDFASLFRELPANASLVSLAKVFELLQMSHLQAMLASASGAPADHQLELSLADPNCIESIKRLDLSAGYRARLTLALDYIRNKIQQQKPPVSVVRGERLVQQASSESSEPEMDASQSSSSSSKESIKSIVSMRTSQTQSSSAIFALAANAETSAPATSATTLNSEQTVEARVSPQPAAAAAEALKEAVAEGAKISPNADFEKPPGAANGHHEKPQVRQEQVALGRGARASSLVSEAARKLEAAQRGEGGGAICFTLKPVAAARRINTAKIATTGADGQSSTATAASDSFATNSSKYPTTTATSGQTPVFVPVRSVCWPPKSNQQQQAPIRSSNGQLHAKLQQELLAIGNKVIGPKPVPPAKPAKLAATKLAASNFGTNSNSNNTTSSLEGSGHRF